MKKDVYRISTNPIKESRFFLDYHLYEKDGSSQFIQIPIDCLQTGYSSDLTAIKNALNNADIIFSLGDIDVVAAIEMGIALSLGKKIHIVTTHPDKTAELLNLFNLDPLDIMFISPEACNQLINQ